MYRLGQGISVGSGEQSRRHSTRHPGRSGNETDGSTDNTLRFMLPDESYIELPLDEVTGWEYSDQAGDAQWTSISGVTVNPDAIVRQTATGVTIFNLPENSIVTLTAINGITVKSLTASGSCQIEFEGLQNGIYLLSFNNQTIKIALNR